MARVLLEQGIVGASLMTRGVAKAILVVLLFGATPVSTLAEGLTSPCTEKQHQCEAPAIARCCCIEAGHGSLPATTETGPKLMSAPVMIAPTAAIACGLSFVFPPETWFRGSTRAARPPLPLHLLNVSILR